MEAISVVIPTYNRSCSIVKSVESVLKQTYPVKEVIIADDCSQDDTEEVLRQIQDERVRYCRLPENKGAGGARNFGVEKAGCDLIAFHDSDDTWTNDKIEKQMAYWAQHPDCGLVYCAYAMTLLGSLRHVVPDLEQMEGLEGRILPNLLVKNTIGAPTVLMPKAVFEAVGGFDESMRSLEDWDFAIRVAKDYPIGFVPEVLLEVAASEGGVSSNVGAYYQNRCYMLRKHRAEYLKTGVLNDAVRNLLEMAERDKLLPQVQKLMLYYMES
ncbi:MAG: glycosyltransferase [Muribaculum sp.]|nr:glycosyltransferase [Muribaculum sp.]